MTPAEAWSAVVAGEDAAVYAYGLVGGRVTGSDRQAALAALTAHRLRRDAAIRQVRSAKATVPAAAAAYDPPFPVTDAASARQLAAVVEQRLAGVYGQLAGAVSGPARKDAALAAQECAARSVAWGAAPQAFPGSG